MTTTEAWAGNEKRWRRRLRKWEKRMAAKKKKRVTVRSKKKGTNWAEVFPELEKFTSALDDVAEKRHQAWLRRVDRFLDLMASYLMASAIKVEKSRGV